MRRAVLLYLALLAACSPALNWRTVRSDAHTLHMLLPCKPDQATRTVPMAGATVALDMQGCTADGATFAVSHVRLGDARQIGAALAGWQAATLANLHATKPQTQAFEIPGGQFGVRWAVQGRHADGRPVSAQAVWFARIHADGIDLFHAVLLADRANTVLADTFFQGLQFPLLRPRP